MPDKDKTISNLQAHILEHMKLIGDLQIEIELRGRHNMNPKYVADLPHSRKLVEAEWTREVEFQWSVTGKLVHRKKWASDIPAPLTDELLEELPIKHRDFLLLFYPNGISCLEVEEESFFAGENRPNALADLWCWWEERKR